MREPTLSQPHQLSGRTKLRFQRRRQIWQTEQSTNGAPPAWPSILSAWIKTFIKQPLVLGVLLMTCLGRMVLTEVSAQTFKTLHTFNSSDGGRTYSGLILSSNTVYGTTISTVFALNIDGTGFRTLHNLNAGTDGDAVFGGLVLSGGTLYGTATDGGTGGYGTMFAVNTDGTGFTTLYSFSGNDGSQPACDLALVGGALYGVTPSGGDLSTGGGYGSGTVFAIHTDGSDFATLYNFSGGADGRFPRNLVLWNNTFFGTASAGGIFGGAATPIGSGTVFAINTDGTGFADLYSFTDATTNALGVYTNSDGLFPFAGLVLSGGFLYGATWLGGSFGSGTVFSLKADGSGFTNLYSFPALTSSGTNSGGAQPRAVLTVSGQTLYGTTSLGGDFGNGTIFAIHTDGTGFTTLYSFRSADNGPYRRSGLLLSGNTLYGTTCGYTYTTSGYGTVFSLSFTPQLSITGSGANVILTWPTNYAGFDYTGYTLQSTTNLSSPVWTTIPSGPVVVNGQYTVTNPVFGAQQFYRLARLAQ